MFFLQIFIQNVLYRGILLLSLGMLSKKQWALRPSHAALRLFPRWQGGWPAAAQAAWSRNAMPRRPSSAKDLVIKFLGKISWAFFLSPYLEQHMAHSPHRERHKLTNTDVKICHKFKFPSVHIWTNMSMTCKPSQLSRIVNGGCLQWFIILFYTGDILPKKEIRNWKK
jgi:hypothetical protein